jgi:hypothetical protein
LKQASVRKDFFFEKKVAAQDLPPPLWAPLWGRAGVGAVPRRKADRETGKHFFFEKKKQKTLADRARSTRIGSAQTGKAFCFFFSKKKTFLPYPPSCFSIML